MQRHFVSKIIAVGFVASLAFGLAEWAPSADIDAAKVAPIRARMQAFVDQQEIAGAVTVVGSKDGIANLEAVGLLNLESKQPMPRDALFRIASMTKPITAIGIMILVDESKLSVEDPVEKHLPEFKGQMLVAERAKDSVTLKKPSRPITVRDLLTHTSGLPGRMPDGLADLYARRNHTLAEGVMAFSQRPLEFEPGSRWAYCNPGIDTLGRIIEVASGQSYEDFLAKRIFQPLGMKETTFYPTAEQLKRAAVIYAKKDSKLVPAANVFLGLPPGARYPIPAGGLFSTGADLARLYQMMLSKGALGKVRIISEKSVAEMTKLQTGDLQTGFVPGMGFGFGWGVVRAPQGVTEMLSPGSYGHGGAFGTQAWIDPHKDLFVVLLIQRTGLPNADASKMRQELQALATGALPSAPEGFQPLFNGKDLAGWKVLGGKMEAWGAADGLLFTSGSGGGWLMTEKPYGDFELRLEYKLPPNGNSGVALRSPLQGDPAYTGMEIQLLDDAGAAYKKLRPAQYTGSIYDVVAAKRGATKPAGEWNQMHIVARGRKVAITLNGTVIVDANLDDYKDRAKADPEKKLREHPGLLRDSGHLGLQSHGSRVEFRNIVVKPL